MLQRVAQSLFADTEEAVLVSDQAGRFLDANPAACALLGYSRDQLLQLRSSSIVVGGQEQSANGQLPGRAKGRRRGDTQLYHKDGTVIPVEAFSVIISDPDGPLNVTFLRSITRVSGDNSSPPQGDEVDFVPQPFTNFGTWEWDLSRNIVFGSSPYQHSSESGPRTATWTLHEFLKSVHPDDRSLVIAAQSDLLVGSADLEFRLYDPDGRIRFVHGRRDLANGLGDHRRNPHFLLMDITERKQIEEALLASELRFRQLFDQAPVMYITTSNVHDRSTIVEANTLFLSTLGYERDEVIGRRLLDFYSYESQLAYQRGEGHRSKMGSEISATARQLLTRDGRVVEVMLWVWPENGPDGNWVGSRVAFVDVTDQKRAEKALRQSEERFRTAFEDAPIGMNLIDPEGRILLANEAFCTLIGYTQEELLARTIRDITHPDDLADNLRQLQRHLTAEIGPYQLEKRYIRKDGGIVWVRLASSLVRNADGSPLHLIGQIEDITARKHAEQELRASEERYRSLVEHLPAVVYLLAADERQTTLYVSPYIETLIGETPEQVQSRQEHWLTQVHPDDRERAAEEDKRIATPGRVFRVDYRRRTRTGDYVWVRDECVPLVDKSGQIVGYQGFMIDMSHQVRLEALEIESRTREEQRDQLQVILDHLPVAILILQEPDGQVEQANATAIQMILGEDCTSSTLPVYRRDFRLVWSDTTTPTRHESPGYRALRGELVRNEQLLLETADGHHIPVLAHAAPLPATAEGISRSVLVLQDVTRLREAEQLKDDFLALVSHEFRTPLTAIHGGAHLLHTQSAALDMTTREELLRDIVIESDRLERRLRNILHLTSVMAGQLVVQTEPVMLGALARDVAKESGIQLPQHTFRLDFPSRMPPAEADPALLAEVLTNLYENAAKYSPGGGDIVTTGFTSEESVVLEVSDTGIGIAPEQVERVFERFHRAGADPTVRGMGLGLYLSRYLIEAQRGTLTARSSGIGQGATFIVTLPIAREWKAAADDDSTTAATEANSWSANT